MRSGVLLALSLGLLLAVGAGATSAARAPAGPPGALAFWNAQRGLLGTGKAVCEGACARGTIQLTEDGGRTWKTVLQTADAVTQLDTAGRASAWAVVQHCATLTCRSRVLRTVNGGRTWSPVARGMTGVSFATPQIGLGYRTTLTGGTTLYRSTNGGKVWSRLPSPCLGPVKMAASISLVTPQHGFIVCNGGFAAGSSNKSVRETTDGGKTWKTRSRAILGTAPSGLLSVVGFVSNAAFTPSGFGGLCQYRAPLLMTTTGGRKWKLARVVEPHRDACLALAVAPGAVYALKQTRALYRLVVSTNGGGKWRVVKRV